MSGNRGAPDGSDVVLPFIYVPAGEPAPAEWLSAHPDPVRLAARLVPRPAATVDAPPEMPATDAK